MKKTPIVYIIAGPNGSGKTTFAVEFLPKIAGCRNFINADLIARGLSPLDVDAAAIAAGRLFLTQIRLQMNARHDFAFETTLAGLSYITLINAMRRVGYHVHLNPTLIYERSLEAERIMNREVFEKIQKQAEGKP